MRYQEMAVAFKAVVVVGWLLAWAVIQIRRSIHA